MPLIQAATLTADVLDFITDQPVEGVDASVCRQSDPGCTGPLMTGQTDVTGYVQLPLPSERGIASLGTDVFVQFTSPNIVTTLSYLGYPVTEPQTSVGEPYVLVATPEEVTSSTAHVLVRAGAITIVFMYPTPQ